MHVEQRVYLGVSSTVLDPSALSARLGLTPDEEIPQGSRPSPRGAPLPLAHLWKLNSGAPASLRLDDQLAALLDRIEPRAAEIRALAASGDAAVYISAVRTFVPEPEPERDPEDFDSEPRHDPSLAAIGFHLDPRTLARLAGLGVGLDVDEYG